MKILFVTGKLIILFLFANSCQSQGTSSVNQRTLFSNSKPDDIGKYFYRIFKDGQKNEFQKWMYDQSYTSRFWNESQSYGNSKFPWSKTKYSKCKIEKKFENSDEYAVYIYFIDEDTNMSYKIRFLLMKALKKNNDEKYYLSTSYPTNIIKLRD